MARIATPTPLKVLSGRSPGRDSGGRKIAKPPSFVRVAPSAPGWLDREAKAEWRRIVPELERLELVKAPSRSSLAAMCVAWSQFVTATRILDAEGLIVEGLHGSRAHPALAIQQSASSALRQWAAEFGLTAASETKVRSKAPAKDDPDFD